MKQVLQSHTGNAWQSQTFAPRSHCFPNLASKGDVGREERPVISPPRRGEDKAEGLDCAKRVEPGELRNSGNA